MDIENTRVWLQLQVLVAHLVHYHASLLKTYTATLSLSVGGIDEMIDKCTFDLNEIDGMTSN